ncbi:MAG: hypothetical protein WCD76_21385 [Pyrinomonadaceae bacterium]
MNQHQHTGGLFPFVFFAAAAAARSNEWREGMRAQSLTQNPRVTVTPSPLIAAAIARSQEWRAKANPAPTR